MLIILANLPKVSVPFVRIFSLTSSSTFESTKASEFSIIFNKTGNVYHIGAANTLHLTSLQWSDFDREPK